MRNNFNAEQERDNIVEWIKEYFEKQNCNGAIIGISGGKDSTVVAGLLVRALGKEKVFGVLMPNGEQKDISDSLDVVKFLGINYDVVNIEDMFRSTIIATQVQGLQAITNIAPRLRMTTLYALAAEKHMRVAGTGNASEGFVGYTTKWGDNACDFNVLATYDTEEVVAIGDTLGYDEKLTHKTPSDGLCGKSDEDNLCCTYAQINEYMHTGTTGNKEVDSLIETKHEIARHKVEPIPVYDSIEEITKF